MARKHGKDADFSFDTVDLEDELNQVSARWTVPPAEITSFTDAYGNFLPGKPSLVYDVSGFADLEAGAGDVTIFDELGLEAEEIDFEPDGTIGYNGFAFVTSYEITASVSGPITYSASFQHNGGSAAADGAAPTRGA